MIAMQYSFTLPADYDMSTIERRVRNKGHVLDEHLPLVFKAYLVASKDDSELPSQENLYAPFYLWRDCDGMRDFLLSPGFAGLARDFGWPGVRSWPALLSARQEGDLSQARAASREIRQVAAFTDLAELMQRETRQSSSALQEEQALLALSAFEPTSWTMVRFRLWRKARAPANAPGVQTYRVLHVSNPGGNR